MPPTRPSLACTSLAALAALSVARIDPASADVDPGAIRAHVEVLASDELLGRETGEPGGRRASEYIAEQMARIGLSPLPGAGDFYLPYTLYLDGFDPEGTRLVVGAGSHAIEGRGGEDLEPFDFSDEGEREAEVVFAGYGITAPDLEHDDYEGLDAEGKLVLVLRHAPGENDPSSPFEAEGAATHAYFRTKARNAEEHGAVGMLLVTDPLNHTADDAARGRGALGLEPPDSAPQDTSASPFLAVHVSWRLADALMAGAGRSLVEVQRAIDDGTLHASEVSLDGVRARVEVERLRRTVEVPTRNVAGMLPGRDPELREELVVVGAHHDHLGGYETPGEEDAIHNGADDNASGVAGLLEIARALADASDPPRRSVLFTTFSGEERGLLGSRAMVRDEQIPMDDVVFMLNLDMIGRNPEDPLTIIGDGFSRGVVEIIDATNAEIGLDLAYSGTDYAGNSDHDPFFRRDVPFIMLFTGLHDDYHQVSDHPEKLAYERMAAIARLGAALVSDVADSDEPPRFIHRVAWLGVQVEVLPADEEDEAVVTGVDAGSRAESAGFATGDVLVAFDEAPLENAATVGDAFRSIEPGSEATISVRRGDGEATLAIARAHVGYLGVWPGTVDEDRRARLGLAPTEGVLLRRVVGEGPSDAAGLEAGDILLSIAGRPVTPGTLGSVLAQIGAGEPVTVRLVRDGERMQLPLTLGERPTR